MGHRALEGSPRGSGLPPAGLMGSCPSSKGANWVSVCPPDHRHLHTEGWAELCSCRPDGAVAQAGRAQSRL